MKKYALSLLCGGLILSLPACCGWCKKEEAPAVVETATEKITVESTIDVETATTTEEIAPSAEQVVEVAAADAKPADAEAAVKA
jgi:hypothetical protein